MEGMVAVGPRSNEMKVQAGLERATGSGKSIDIVDGLLLQSRTVSSYVAMLEPRSICIKQRRGTCRLHGGGELGKLHDLDRNKYRLPRWFHLSQEGYLLPCLYFRVESTINPNQTSDMILEVSGRMLILTAKSLYCR